jgi:hypothetical protein
MFNDSLFVFEVEGGGAYQYLVMQPSARLFSIWLAGLFCPILAFGGFAASPT